MTSLDWFAKLEVVNISSKVNSYQPSKTRVVTSPTETRDIRSTVLFSGTFLLNKTSLRTSPNVGRTLLCSNIASWPTSQWSVADLVLGLLLAMMRMVLVIFDTKQIIFMIFTQEWVHQFPDGLLLSQIDSLFANCFYFLIIQFINTLFCQIHYSARFEAKEDLSRILDVASNDKGDKLDNYKMIYEVVWSEMSIFIL